MIPISPLWKRAYTLDSGLVLRQIWSMEYWVIFLAVKTFVKENEREAAKKWTKRANHLETESVDPQFIVTNRKRLLRLGLDSCSFPGFWLYDVENGRFHKLFKWSIIQTRRLMSLSLKFWPCSACTLCFQQLKINTGQEMLQAWKCIQCHKQQLQPALPPQGDDQGSRPGIRF